MFISQQVTSCLINHSELCVSHASWINNHVGFLFIDFGLLHKRTEVANCRYVRLINEWLMERRLSQYPFDGILVVSLHITSRHILIVRSHHFPQVVCCNLYQLMLQTKGIFNSIYQWQPSFGSQFFDVFSFVDMCWPSGCWIQHSVCLDISCWMKRPLTEIFALLVHPDTVYVKFKPCVAEGKCC